MKTKEQLIKESYWEHFDVCKPDGNGWSEYEYWKDLDNPIWNIPIEEKDNFLVEKWRPISLKGLETNNGWNNITTIDTLPIKADWYDFLSKDGNKVENKFFDRKTPGYLDIFPRFYSHWAEQRRLPMY